MTITVTPGTGQTIQTIDDVAKGAGASSASTLRTVIATDQSAVPVTGTFWQTTQPVSLASVPSHAVTNAGTFATQVTTLGGVAPAYGSGANGSTVLRVALATDSPGIASTVAHDAVGTSVDPLLVGGYASATAPTSVSADGDATRAWFLRNGSLATTVTAAGALIGGDAANGLDVDVTRLPGDAAHDAADTGNPLKIGGRARSSEIAAVANNDRSDLITDLVGKLITLPYANPENFVSGAITTAMTATTSTSLVAGPGAGLRNYITSIVVSNSHATVGTDVVIQDGSAGTTLMTIPAAAVYGGAVINLPVPLRQPTANTALFCANVTTGASTKVSAVGYKGA